MLYPLLVLGAIVVVALAWRVANLNSDNRGARSDSTPSSAIPRSEAGVRALLQAGRKIEAIKLLRLVRGVGLKEAKDMVDELERSGILSPPAPNAPPALAGAPDSDQEIHRLIAAGDLIGAIRRYRELTGAGLTEAKSAVDRLAAGS